MANLENLNQSQENLSSPQAGGLQFRDYAPAGLANGASGAGGNEANIGNALEIPPMNYGQAGLGAGQYGLESLGMQYSQSGSINPGGPEITAGLGGVNPGGPEITAGFGGVNPGGPENLYVPGGQAGGYGPEGEQGGFGQGQGPHGRHKHHHHHGHCNDSALTNATTGTTATNEAETAVPSTTEVPTTSTTSSDPYIAQLQTSDPTMAQTLTDASTQLSQAGFSQLEGYVQQQGANGQNDAQIMSQALTQAGLGTTDAAALQTVLQADMPQALTSSGTAAAATSSDPYIAQLQTSDPTMAQTLTDASTQLSQAGYAQLEGYVQQQGPSGQNDSQIMSQALTQPGLLSSTDATALQTVLQNDMPSALANTTATTAPAATNGVATTTSTSSAAA